MSKATPGPWEAVLPGDPRGQPVCYYRGLVALVSANERPLSVVTQGGRTVEMEEWEANARLIAAAPLLLEVLELAVRQNEHDMLLTGEELRKCCAAIAKARGTT